MSEQVNFSDFVNNLRHLMNDYYDDFWPHFLTFSEHVDRYYVFGAPVLLILFLIVGNASSIIDFVIFCTFVGTTSIKIWKYWEVIEQKSRRKPMTIQPVITTSGNYPNLQKRKYGIHSAHQESGVNEVCEDTSSSKFGDEDTSTIGGSQEGSRRSQRYPLSLREWSSVTSPGFTTRLVKQAGFSNGDARNWNKSPFQYSPDRDLQVGEVAYGSKLKRNASPHKAEHGPPMDIISWARNRSLTPTTYVSVKPREPELEKFSDYVNSTSPQRNTNEMSPKWQGGLGGIPNSSIVGKANSQLVASANNIFENSKLSPKNLATSNLSPTPPPTSILEALANRKRIRDTEAGFQSSRSPTQNKRASNSIANIYSDDLSKDAKRAKFLSHDANAVLPPYSMMPLPDLRVNDDEPMMATESILEQLNQTEKRYLPEDDSPPFRQGSKKMKGNNAIGSRNMAGAGTAKKRKMLNSLGPLEDEVQEKTIKICNCTECYDELAGAKVDQYGNSIIKTTPNGDGSRETRSRTIRKVVDQATETEPDLPVVTRLEESANRRVITKEQVKHDKSLRKKRLQIMLEISKDKKAKLQTPNSAQSDGFPAQTNVTGTTASMQFLSHPSTSITTPGIPSTCQSVTVSVISSPAAEPSRTAGENTVQPTVSSVAPTVTTTTPPVFVPSATIANAPSQTGSAPAAEKPQFNWGSPLTSSSNNSEQKEVPRAADLSSAPAQTLSASGNMNSTLPRFSNGVKSLGGTVVDGQLNQEVSSSSSKGSNSALNLFQFGKPVSEQEKRKDPPTFNVTGNSFTFGSTPATGPTASNEPGKPFMFGSPVSTSVAGTVSISNENNKPFTFGSSAPARTTSSSGITGTASTTQASTASNIFGASTNMVSNNDTSKNSFELGTSAPVTFKPADKGMPVASIFDVTSAVTSSSSIQFGQPTSSSTGAGTQSQNSSTISSASRNLFGAFSNSEESARDQKPQASSTPIMPPNNSILGGSTSSTNTNSDTMKPFIFGKSVNPPQQDAPLNFSTNSTSTNNSFGAFGSAAGFGTTVSTGAAPTSSIFSPSTAVKPDGNSNQAANTQNPPSNMFQFGQNQTSKPGDTSNSTGNSFGIFGSGANAGAPSSIGTFGTPLKTNSTDFNPGQSSSASAFQFGQSSASTMPKSETNVSTNMSGQGTNIFGSSANNSASLPTFGSAFKPSTSNPSQNSASATNLFQFGQTSSTSASGMSQSNAPGGASNAFVFGSSTNTNAGPQSSPWPSADSTNQNTGSLPNSQFQFGQTQSQTSPTPGGFNFVPPSGFSPAPPAASASPPPMFSFGSTPATGTAAPRRRITARSRRGR